MATMNFINFNVRRRAAFIKRALDNAAIIPAKTNLDSAFSRVIITRKVIR